MSEKSSESTENRSDSQDGLEERIRAHGHDNVSAEHESTFEVTSDDFLTSAGDYILGIEADRTPAEFDPAFVQACQSSQATIEISIECSGHESTVQASGHPELTFASDRSAVVRTSEYVDDRTVAVNADEAACGVDRGLVQELADGAQVTVTLTVE